MDGHNRDAAGGERGRGGQALCGHDFEGQGVYCLNISVPRLTFADRIRPSPDSPRIAAGPPRLHHAASGDVPERTQAHQVAALRLSR